MVFTYEAGSVALGAFRPPNGVLTMVSTLATKTHRTLHHMETDETMVGVE